MSKLLHTDQQLLCDWAKLVVELFNGTMCYQVGSSTTDEPHRDIDIRTMLETADFNTLNGQLNIDRFNLAVSLWGQKVTGLPIDFQVQDREWANDKYPGKHRNAVGMGMLAVGDRAEDATRALKDGGK